SPCGRGGDGGTPSEFATLRGGSGEVAGERQRLSPGRRLMSLWATSPPRHGHGVAHRRWTRRTGRTSFQRRFGAAIFAPMSEVTRILSAIEQGDPSAAEQLLPLVYDELRLLATQKLAQERPGQTLEATALVHEAYLRLVGQGEEHHWDSRGHFF